MGKGARLVAQADKAIDEAEATGKAIGFIEGIKNYHFPLLQNQLATAGPSSVILGGSKVGDTFKDIQNMLNKFMGKNDPVEVVGSGSNTLYAADEAGDVAKVTGNPLLKNGRITIEQVEQILRCLVVNLQMNTLRF